jgi:acyl-CoA thioesterase
MDANLTQHSATVSYHAAADILPHVLERGGLAYAEAVRDRHLPPDPFIESLGVVLTELGPGRAVHTAVPEQHHLNAAGYLHGGYVTALLDIATGYAMLTSVPPGRTAPHVSIAVQFLGSAPGGTDLIVTGELLRTGSRIGHVRGELRTAEGRLLAIAQSAHAVVDDAPRQVAGSPPSA